MTLKDSCNPPASITASTLEAQEYILTDTLKAAYTPDDFTVVPSYCDVIYSYDVGSVLDATNDPSSAVTGSDDKTFNFFYDRDSAPVDSNQTQTVTVTATSAPSKFQAISGEAEAPASEESDDFPVTFLSPCDYDRLITLTLPA